MKLWGLNQNTFHLDFSGLYFSITEQATGKAFDATSKGNVILYSYHGGQNQQWSWEDVDKTTLINRKYNNKLKFVKSMGGL